MAVNAPERLIIWPFLLVIILFSSEFSHAQETDQVFLRRYSNGTQLYQSSRWYEAAIEFRRAQEAASDLDNWSRALYWVILSELAYSDYGSALRDMDELERKAPISIYSRDMVYHRGRVYFNQGYFEDALILFRRYLDSVFDIDRETEERRAAAFFWMGECLLSLGEFDDAQKCYNWIIERYPESPKLEVSKYRIDLIRQKKIENELLALLQWSHEEALRTSEDFRRQIRIYEYTLNQYQRRIDNASAGNSEFQENQIKEDFSVTADNWQNIYQRLLERARRLNTELEQMINDYYSGGSW